MADTVTLTLSNPLTAQQAERLHAQAKKDYPTGSKITVPQEYAQAIIDAGYAAHVDPEDAAQVTQALGGSAPAKSSGKS
ncbi:hypothetical protein ACFY05_32175 [Microtetraspora fusca]|uniref:Transcriptional regulator n=1 Tax=Microtetraspora fusca TaxID=1997 RepID=A0ABW6VDV2_MICFU